MALKKGPQAFSREEFQRRIDLTKAAMDERGIGTLFVIEHANLIWLSGFTAESAYVEQSLVVSPDLDEPLLCLRRMDAPGALWESYIDRDNILGFPEHLIANPDENGFDFMIARLRDLGVLRGPIGIEFGDLTVHQVEYLKKRLAPETVVDATDLVKWLRLVKSDEEIAVMRQAAQISDDAMDAAIKAIAPGKKGAEAAAAAADVMIRGGTHFDAFNFCASPMIGTCHYHWIDMTNERGSQTNIELGGQVHRYCAGLMRTAHVGPPPDRLKRLHEAEVEGLVAGLEAAKTGNLCSDVADAFYQTIAKHGFEKESRCGYAMGINWTETTASLHSHDRTVLEPNMTFHLMLGNWIDEEFGYVISETFRVTDSGGETMSSLPRDLFVIDA